MYIPDDATVLIGIIKTPTDFRHTHKHTALPCPYRACHIRLWCRLFCGLFAQMAPHNGMASRVYGTNHCLYTQLTDTNVVHINRTTREQHIIT
jgi:hypothetical protein